MGDFKSVMIIFVLIAVIIAIFSLAYQNIMEDAEKIGEDFDIQPDAGEDIQTTIGQKVKFEGSNLATKTDYSDVRYMWDFDGDGINDWDNRALIPAYHTYSYKGTFTATLTITVKNEFHEVSKNDTLLVTVRDNSPPRAVIEVSSNHVNVSEKLQFSALNSSDNEDSSYQLKYQWDMDNDGINDVSGKVVFYSYSAPGDYLAVLTVTDTAGETDTASTMVYVKEGESSEVDVELWNGGNSTLVANTRFSTSKMDFNWNLTESDMAGLVKIEVSLVWEDVTWDLDLCFGCGLNPENGLVYGNDTGGSPGQGEGEVILTAEGGQLMYNGIDQWFLRVTTKENTIFNGGEKKPTEKSPFRVMVTLYYSASS